MAVAPVAPEAGLSFGLIMVALLCVFLLGLNRAYKFTIGALLEALRAMFDAIGFTIPVIGRHVSLGFIGDALGYVDNAVLHAIGTGIQSTEKALHALLGWVSWCFQATAEEVAQLAEGTAQSLHWVKHVLVPAALGAALAPIVRELSHLGSRTLVIERHPVRIIRKTVEVVNPGIKTLEGKVAELEADVAAIGAKAPTIIHKTTTVIEQAPAISIPFPTTRGLDSLWKRVKAIGKTLTPAGIVGLVGAAVFSHFDLGWLRCKGVGKVGRGLCGISGLLETLFSDAIEALVVADLCQFTTALAYAARKFEPELIAFVDVENALIGCRGITLPPALTVGALDLPPVTGYTLS